jgi:hypothetical protein
MWIAMERIDGVSLFKALPRTRASECLYIALSQDKQIATRLGLELAKRGMDVWLDEWAIQVGDSMSRKVEDALQNCKYVILLLCPRAVASNWLDREWRAAFSKEMQSGEVTVLLVLADKCVIPPLLRDRKHADLSESLERGLNELVSFLGKHKSSSSSMLVTPNRALAFREEVFPDGGPGW